MADGEKPPRTRPPVPPSVGKPLPRVWKVDPEPETNALEPRKSRKERLAEEKAVAADAEAAAADAKARAEAQAARKATKAAREAARAKGKTLVEDTPELDTYESRRKARLTLGLAIAGFALIGVILVAQKIGGGGSDEEEAAPPVIVTENPNGAAPPITGTAPNPAIELEANNLLSTARGLASNGKTKEASVALERVVASYPKSKAAGEARDALARPSRNLPLFLGGSTVVADPTAAKSGLVAPPVPVVSADRPDPGGIAPGNSSSAELHLPSNAPPTSAGTAPSGMAARPIPAGFQADLEEGVHASGWPNRIVSERDGATMVLVPAGAFSQGRDDGAPDEGPEHKVALGAYYIDQHEVTNKQFALYVSETGRKVGPAPKAPLDPASPDPSASIDPDRPAVNLTVREAKAYCDWAGKSLPTEAQWEAAARTTDGRLSPWGSTAPTWSKERAPRQVDKVMAFPLDQSPYGAFDLAGNVWEWTQDWFDPRYYQGMRGSTTPSPTGPSASRMRPPQVVVKGGSKTWAAAWREGLKLDTRLPYVGFRGVLAVDTGAPQVAPAAVSPGQPNPGPNVVVPF